MIHIENVWENKEPFNIPQSAASAARVYVLLLTAMWIEYAFCSHKPPVTSYVYELHERMHACVCAHAGCYQCTHKSTNIHLAHWASWLQIPSTHIQMHMFVSFKQLEWTIANLHRAFYPISILQLRLHSIVLCLYLQSTYDLSFAKICPQIWLNKLLWNHLRWRK